jgi:2-polyprenyl-3-methyl-5-hydroxy-6-metoxy-1,4-benzoquinol methylase
MTDDEKIRPAARVAALLERGPVAVPRDSLPARLRALVRALLLRASRPHARYAREVDDAVLAALMGLEDELERTRERHTEQIQRLEDLAREFVYTAESLRRGVSAADRTASWARRTVEPIAAELYALPYLADSPFELLSSPVGEAIGYRSASSLKDGESGYVAFESLFRGPAERVAASQRPYLTLVRAHEPVLDVGCGRGEFLALLAAEGIEARGVDADAGMVHRCNELGLDATHADASEYLEGLADGALGTIFSAQVIEHLPQAQLRGLLDLGVSKLRPGGLFIAETVNPHRVSSLKTFWVDPTHQHPIFPEVALALCAIAGFESAYVFAPTFESFEAARFAAPSYAVVAATAASNAPAAPAAGGTAGAA